MKRVIAFWVLAFLFSGCTLRKDVQEKRAIGKTLQKTLYKQILTDADWAMQQQPITVTAEVSLRSAGTKHDFFSEGDYWWPDPVDLDAPYIQKDGVTNPDNFVAHRQAMIRFSRIVGALASAYKITGDEKYVKQAVAHLKAWFIDQETYMNPNLLYAQAIKGRYTGRGIGIIDTIHLMEVAQGVRVMQESNLLEDNVLAEIKDWFSQYLVWLTTHQYGIDEMNAKNNHGTCWTMQVASFAKFTDNKELMEFCSDRYKTILLPNQMAVDGSFPKELARTKPYGYALFNLDAMAMICQVLSTHEDDLWSFQTDDGRSIQKGIQYMYPFIVNKSNWPFAKDVMYWEEWPVAQPALLFGAKAFREMTWLASWENLEHSSQVEEVNRNLPIRYPILWF